MKEVKRGIGGLQQRAERMHVQATKELLRTREEASLLRLKLAEAEAEVAAATQAGLAGSRAACSAQSTAPLTLESLRTQIAELRLRQEPYLNLPAPSITAR